MGVMGYRPWEVLYLCPRDLATIMRGFFIQSQLMQVGVMVSEMVDVEVFLRKGPRLSPQDDAEGMARLKDMFGVD